MGDIKVLLREAVPLEDSEPDLATVAGRVHRRRHRRRTRRRLGAGVVALGLIGGTVAGWDALDRDRGDVVTAPADGPGDPERRRTWADTTDAEVFAWLLASRDWLADADVEWPVAPSDFLSDPPQQGIIVIGTLAEVRPGPVSRAPAGPLWDCDTRHCRPPAPVTTVETVIDVEEILPGDQAGPDSVVVPWVTAVGEVDQATGDRLAAPFEDDAPIGARVLVFLRPGEGDPDDWQPVEPSGIVIEDGDRVAIPQPGGDGSELDLSFDEYLADLGRAFAD